MYENIFTILIALVVIFAIIFVKLAIIDYFVYKRRLNAIHEQPWLLNKHGKNYQKPFPAYPYITIKIDVSGRRCNGFDDFIDEWIIENSDYNFEEQYKQETHEWEKACENKLINLKPFNNGYKFEELNQEYTNYLNELYSNYYNELFNNYQTRKCFRFVFSRTQTRYRQENYIKYPYSVKTTIGEEMFSLNEINEIYKELEDIDFQTTRKKYHSKNQRSLMTKELRKKIMIRDNFTCQQCGKYMPDEVGLQVDHIIPVTKGGKSIESNLQVLCDKCNRKKFTKITALSKCS